MRGIRQHGDVVERVSVDQYDIGQTVLPHLPLGSRPDVLVFQTEPLREPIEVTGPIEVVLWVVTFAADTDFTAKLIDVYPPSAWYPLGYALNLTDSIGGSATGPAASGARPPRRACPCR